MTMMTMIVKLTYEEDSEWIPGWSKSSVGVVLARDGDDVLIVTAAWFIVRLVLWYLPETTTTITTHTTKKVNLGYITVHSKAKLNLVHLITITT